MLKQTNNLIHCITNPISINDCANLILALGAKPIMACHPDEVESITSNSSALALNLGNFDDIRAKSMMISAKCAKENKIPFILDLVGVACSTLRLNYAKELVSLYCPTVIKGNISECKAFYGMTSHAHGVDADIQDEDPSDSSLSGISCRHLSNCDYQGSRYPLYSDRSHRWLPCPASGSKVPSFWYLPSCKRLPFVSCNLRYQ